MNFRDPVLERARFLLLQLAEGDQDLLDREIRAELNTHGEVHLSCMTERMTTLWEQRHGRKLELPQSDPPKGFGGKLVERLQALLRR